MHKVSMMVSIPDENWDVFKESVEETGEVQFQYKGSTIFAKII